jgi:hypothetical protein
MFAARNICAPLVISLYAPDDEMLVLTPHSRAHPAPAIKTCCIDFDVVLEPAATRPVNVRPRDAQLLVCA